MSLMPNIPTGSQAPSFPEILYREFNAGRITKDEYDTRNAIWVAENAREYHSRRYPQLSQQLVEYARARTNGVRTEMGPDESQRIGAWIRAVNSLLQDNDADHSLLVWSLERLREKKLSRHVEMITLRLATFIHSIPANFTLALESQKKDSEYRQAKERGR